MMYAFGFYVASAASVAQPFAWQWWAIIVIGAAFSALCDEVAKKNG